MDPRILIENYKNKERSRNDGFERNQRLINEFNSMIDSHLNFLVAGMKSQSNFSLERKTEPERVLVTASYESGSTKLIGPWFLIRGSNDDKIVIEMTYLWKHAASDDVKKPIRTELDLRSCIDPSTDVSDLFCIYCITTELNLLDSLHNGIDRQNELPSAAKGKVSGY